MNETLLPAHGSLLREAEKIQLVARTISEIESSKVRIADEDVKRLLARLKGKLTAYQSHQEPVRWSEHTDKLKEADQARDADVSALFTSIRAYKLSKRPAEQTAYKTLNSLIKPYKDLTGRNYEEETAVIARLLMQLKSDEYRDDVATLNLTHHVTHLTESQAQFEAAFTAKVKAKIAKPKVNLPKEREALFEEYQRFCQYIDALAWGKGTELYTKLLDIINQVRQHFTEVVHKRTGRSKKHAQKTKESTTPTVEGSEEEGTSTDVSSDTAHTTSERTEVSSATQGEVGERD